MDWTPFARKVELSAGASTLHKSRLKPLHDLLTAPGTLPQVILRETARVRNVTHWWFSDVESRHGTVLAEIEAEARRNLKVHRRASFHEHLHVGGENELGQTLIALVDGSGAPVEIGYGMVLARTEATSDVSKIPLVELQVEGASGGSGAHTGYSAFIEHITGPISFRDGAFVAARESIATLLGVLRAPSAKVTVGQKLVTVKGRATTMYPLSLLLEQYNEALELKGGVHRLFKLQGVPIAGTWYASSAGDKATTQANFEVPLRRLMSDEFVALFSNGAPKKIFTHGRPRVQATVNKFFGALGDKGRAEGLLMLYYFVTAIEAYQHRFASGGAELADHAAKNQYELLPKTPPNDFLRVGLLDAEKLAVAHHTADAGRWATLKADLQADLDHILTQSYSARFHGPADGKPDYAFAAWQDAVFVPGRGFRYTGEDATRYGDACAKECETKDCGRPRGHGGNHGDRIRAELPLTGTGKPVPVPLHFVEDVGGEVLEPVVVLEDRRNQSDLSRTVKPTSDDVAAAPGINALVAARTL